MTRLGIWKSGEALRIFWVPPRSGECGVKSEKNAPESKSLQKQSRKKMKTQSGMSKNCLAKICARLPEDPSSSLLQSVPGLEITSTHVHSRILIGRNDSEKKNKTIQKFGLSEGWNISLLAALVRKLWLIQWLQSYESHFLAAVVAYLKSEIGTTGVRENVGYMRCPPSKNLAYLNEVL